ncbi:hypothetical protein Taro_046111 [Colocasia esculenta]|uniref:Uncharacterized protein n=1 Tax=Colocasia esculenta TaxID=4460 RepID=A0A843X1L1_COLES|nr:hypothetical protein [Colocasia esculenta]
MEQDLEKPLLPTKSSSGNGMGLVAFGVRGSCVFIAPYVHEVLWGAWAQSSRSNPLIPCSHVSRKNHIFELQTKCVDTQTECVDTTGYYFRSGFWEGQLLTRSFGGSRSARDSLGRHVHVTAGLSERVHVCRVSPAGCSGDNRADEGSARPGRFAVGISRRFDLLELGLASSHREDDTWSGGNLVRALFFAFFVKVLMSLGDLDDGFRSRVRTCYRGCSESRDQVATPHAVAF